ncbi:MAG: Single-stranded DNA-binding protein, partial [uncultured Gemmatimonadetes bacterium]
GSQPEQGDAHRQHRGRSRDPGRCQREPRCAVQPGDGVPEEGWNRRHPLASHRRLGAPECRGRRSIQRGREVREEGYQALRGGRDRVPLLRRQGRRHQVRHRDSPARAAPAGQLRRRWWWWGLRRWWRWVRRRRRQPWRLLRWLVGRRTRRCARRRWWRRRRWLVRRLPGAGHGRRRRSAVL